MDSKNIDYIYFNHYFRREDSQINTIQTLDQTLQLRGDIINNQDKYEVALDSFQVNTQLIPLVDSDNGWENSNITSSKQYYLGLYDNATPAVSKSALNFYPALLNSVDNNPDFVGEMYNFRNLWKSIQNAITASADNLVGGTATNAQKPHIRYDPKTQKFNLWANATNFEYATTTIGSTVVDAQPIILYVDKGLFTKIFHAFPNVRGEPEDANIVFANGSPAYKIIFEQSTDNKGELFSTSFDSTGTFLRLEQEWKTIANICEFRGIRIINNRSGNFPEFQGNKQAWVDKVNASGIDTDYIVGDFYPTIHDVEDIKSISFKTNEYRWHSLNNTQDPLNISHCQFSYVDRYGKSVQLRNPMGMLANCKYVFRKK